MNSVLMSFKPYWGFLIIAEAMGWNIPQKKLVELRKNIPVSEKWDRRVFIYLSKDKNSFKRIPEEYQPFMHKLLGKVIGEFVCDYYGKFWWYNGHISGGNYIRLEESCVSTEERIAYCFNKDFYGLHISDLFVYDKENPRELYEFLNYNKHLVCEEKGCYGGDCWTCPYNAILVRPPQSWCYVDCIKAVRKK